MEYDDTCDSGPRSTGTARPGDCDRPRLAIDGSKPTGSALILSTRWGTLVAKHEQATRAATLPVAHHVAQYHVIILALGAHGRAYDLRALNVVGRHDALAHAIGAAGTEPVGCHLLQ